MSDKRLFLVVVSVQATSVEPIIVHTEISIDWKQSSDEMLGGALEAAIDKYPESRVISKGVYDITSIAKADPNG